MVVKFWQFQQKHFAGAAAPLPANNMENFMKPLSAPPQEDETRHGNLTIHRNGKSECRQGVEDRETVLRQFQQDSNIIMTVMDDDELPIHGSCHGKESRILPTTTSPDVRKLIQHNHRSNSVSVIHDDHSQISHGIKKKLFNSEGGKDNMYKSSGLLTPPSSDIPYPEASLSGPSTNDVLGNAENLSSFNSRQDSSVVSSWTFEDESSSPIKDGMGSVIPPHDCTTAAPNQRQSARIQHARDANESGGISRSERLRAERNAQDSEPSAKWSSATFCPSDPAQQSKGTNSRLSNVKTGHGATYEEPRDEEIAVALALLRQAETDDEVNITPHHITKSTRHLKPGMVRWNPYSRQAAERFRTQSRHLDQGSNDIKLTSSSDSQAPSISATVNTKRKEEDRLARVTANAYPRKAPHSQQSQSARRPHAQSMTVFASELTDDTQSPELPQYNQLKPDMDIIRHTIGTTVTINSPNESTQGREDDSTSEIGLDAHGQSEQPVSMMAVLKELSTKRIQPRAGTSADRKYDDLLANMPEQGLPQNLKLPKNFSTLSRTQQERAVRRETLKERDRDLGAIINVYTHFGSLLAVEDLSNVYYHYLGQVKKFVEEVVGKGRSGTHVRKRICDIRGNIRKRLDTLKKQGKVPDPNRADERLKEILDDEYLRKLRIDLQEVRAGLADVKDAYNETKKVVDNIIRHRTRDNKVFVPSASIPRSERSREAYYRSLNNRVAGIRAQLAKFNNYDESRSARNEDSQSEEINLNFGAADEGETSDEDAGDDFISPCVGERPRSVAPEKTLVVAEINELEYLRQQAEVQRHALKPQQSQAASAELAAQMTAKADQRSHAFSQGVQQHDSQMMNDMRRTKTAPLPLPYMSEDDAAHSSLEDDGIDMSSSREFDDSDLDKVGSEADEDEDFNGLPFCRRYVVNAITTGILPESDAEQLTIGSYLRRDRAIKAVGEATKRIKSIWHSRNPDAVDTSYSVTIKNGFEEYEQKMTLGESGAAGCRVWIEFETYSPSADAYEKAKVLKACHAPDLWFVDWEKDVKLTVAEDRNVNANRDNNVPDDECKQAQIGTPEAPRADAGDATMDDDCLFEDISAPEADHINNSPSPTEHTPLEKNVTTRANGDHIRVFTCLAAANRHAKQVFMQWYIGHLPGRANFDFIAAQDDDLEEELRLIGNRSAWQRKESFDILPDEQGTGRTETFRVWVQKLKASGPSN